MLLQERMKEYHFSNSERLIVDFILSKEEQIKDYSTTMIAQETYTSPSTLIRIAKKLGFSGWNELKEDYLNEVKYLRKHFQDIDPNIPFTNKDTMMEISSKITQLYIESAEDTLSLLQYSDLQKAVRMIQKAKSIRLFSISNLNYKCEEFVYKLSRIHKYASVNQTEGMLYHDAAMLDKDDCAICISYSGETPSLLKVVGFLKENQIPIIAITSIGENSLSHLANVTLNICTREKSISKIAGYTSLNSVSLILDILYSCLFSLNYQENLDYKWSVARRIETNRKIDNEIIVEDIK